MRKERYLVPQIEKDLLKKMVFLGGPRQVGKTTLAQSLIKQKKAGYLNWDIAEDRERILKGQLPPEGFLVFDEIHKFRGWRNYLKGLYDAQKGKKRILVTGSARLDYYRRGGDSLQGRYHYLRLHPLSVAELGISNKQDFQTLLTLGGFPEPFFDGSETEAKRWSREYRQRFLQEDLVSLESVQDIGRFEHLILRLPDLVGSPLSINSVREDLQVSHKTVSKWLDILERLYGIYRLPPFGAPKIRAVKKEQKHYHFDWSLIPETGYRFENLVASHLLKWTHFLQDTKGRDVELRYFRDIDGREVDFILTENGKPLLAIECKWSEENVSPHLRYFKERFPSCEAWQLTGSGEKDFETPEGIRVSPAFKYLSSLI